MTLSLSIFSFDSYREYSCRESYALSVSCRAGMPTGQPCFCIAPAIGDNGAYFTVKVRQATSGLYRLVKLFSQVAVTVFAMRKCRKIKSPVKFAAPSPVSRLTGKIFALGCHYRL